MTTFKVFFNNWSNVASCSANGELCVPADMWEDWQKGMSIENWEIDKSLMWEAINAKVPAKGKSAHHFTFEIKGNGVAKNILAKTQEGIFATRFPTDAERLFKEWFTHLCREKFKVTLKF